MNQPTVSTRRHWLLAAAGASLVGCASFSGAEPLKVAVVDIESLNGEGLEVRMMVKLRVQNPTDNAIEFDGATLDLDLRGMSFASGVSAESGRIPRFGELIVSVPVTISAAAMLRQALSLARDRNNQRIRIDYAARGRLAGGMLGGHRFESSGQIDWPPEPAGQAGT